MPVIKIIVKESGFVHIANPVVDALEFDELGVLVKMLKMDPKWEFNNRDLQRRLGIGRDALQRITKRLREVGVLITVANKQGDGSFDGWTWYVAGSPIQRSAGNSVCLKTGVPEIQVELIQEKVKNKKEEKNNISLREKVFSSKNEASASSAAASDNVESPAATTNARNQLSTPNDLPGEEPPANCPPQQANAPEKLTKGKRACEERYKQEVQEIFDFWVEKIKPFEPRLTDDIRKIIIKQFDDGFTVRDLKWAIYGCSKSGHHMGKNLQQQKYNDLPHICKKLLWLKQFGNDAWQREINPPKPTFNL